MNEIRWNKLFSFMARATGDSCSPASIAKTLRGLSLLAYHPGTEFLEWGANKITSAVEQPGFRVELVGIIRSTVHAMTTLNHDSPHLFEAILKRLTTENERYPMGDVCSLMWCFTLMGKDTNTLRSALKLRFKDLGVHSLEFKNMMCLAQVLIHERVMKKEESHHCFLPEDVENECLRVWEQAQRTRPPLTEAKLVCQTLDSMGYVACDSYFLEDIPLQGVYVVY